MRYKETSQQHCPFKSSPLPIFTPGMTGIDGLTLEQGRFKRDIGRIGTAKVKIAMTEAWRPPWGRQRDHTMDTSSHICQA